MIKTKLKFVLILVLFSLTQSPQAWAFDNTPPSTTYSANGTIGLNSWYITSVGVTLSATEDNGSVASTEYWVDNGPHSVVNYLDGAPTQVQFNVSSPGTHTVSYFSTNADGVAEDTQTTPSFKIDTSSPSNWRDFNAVPGGNSHTFVMSITVDDNPSGLDIATAYYNYTVNGSTYGYYTNTGNCNSEFISQDSSKEPPESGSGWRAIPTLNPNTNGATTITMSTDAIDFCNSSWNLIEAVQFYIKDVAGNESYKLQLLFGPWVEMKGASTHSQGAINFSAEGNADYLVSSGGTPINNLVSNAGWYSPSYTMPLTNMSYDYWYTKLGSPTTSLPAGRLPTVAGVYRVDSDFTIDSGTVPSGLSTTQNFGAVIFVNGRLSVNDDYSLHPSSGLVFIVKDNFRTRSSVNNISGFFIVDDDIDISYNGNNSLLFTLTGGVVGSGNWRFGKNLGGQSNTAGPSERFVFQPSYLSNKDLIRYLSVAPNYQWAEVAP